MPNSAAPGPTISLLRITALSLGMIVLLDSCSPPYTPEILPVTRPDQSPDAYQIPDTKIKIAAFFYNQKDSLKKIFPEHSKWFWRAHIATVKVAIAYDGQNINELTFNSGYITSSGNVYPIISSHQAYDIAWGTGNPYIRIENDIYNTAILLFTFVTLGVGSLVWVLPSPFDQPAPDATPFGRDINYHALPSKITLQPGSLQAGFLYVALPKAADLDKLHDAQLTLLLTTKTTGAAVPHEIRINLPEASKPAS